MARTRYLEKIVEYGVIRLAAFSSILIFIFVIGLMLSESLPFLFSYNPIDFFTRTRWYPGSREYGAAALFYGSFFIAVLAIVLAAIPAIALAIYVHEVAGQRIRRVLLPLIRVYCGIPAVFYGFIGLTLVAPFIEKNFLVRTSLNGFNAAILLSLMAIPIIARVILESLNSAPAETKTAARVLGAGKMQTLIKITLPSVFSGIIAGIIAAFIRILGETMTVLMIAGGAAHITSDLFAPMRTITYTIASEMGNVFQGTEHYHALFFLGLMLFVFTMLVNGLSLYLVKRTSVRRNVRI